MSASSDVDSSLRQLNTIQERAIVCKQVVAQLEHFMNTNGPLYPEFPGDVYLLARNGLDDSRDDLRQLDLIILDVEDTDTQRTARKLRFEITSLSTQLSTILHPIRSIPDDILLLIFQWCTSSHKYRSDTCGSLDNQHPSWTVTHVCRRWRHLALTSPPLWSTVNLSECSLKQLEHILLPRLALQLQRSGNALLAVVIDDKAPCAMVLHDHDKLVSLLRSTSNRWWYLRLSIQLPDDVYDDDAVFAGCSFDNLTHLVVKDDVSSTEDNIPVTAFRHAPRLTHVYSYGEYNIDVDWTKIEVYRTCLFCLAKLSCLPSLQKLTVEAAGDYGRRLEVFHGLPPIQLPHLHTLILLFDDPMILNHLSMPRLETLHVHLPYHIFDSAKFPDLRQCSSRLRNLSVTSEHSGNPQLLVSFLAGAPHVTTLYLADGLLLRMGILQLNGTPDDLFPNLESLRLEVSTLWRKGKNEEVERIIESRLRVPIPKVRELRLIGDPGLDRLRERGLLDVWEATFKKLRSFGIKVISINSNDLDA